jgi:hypothetical protein
MAMSIAIDGLILYQTCALYQKDWLQKGLLWAEERIVLVRQMNYYR